MHLSDSCQVDDFNFVFTGKNSRNNGLFCSYTNNSDLPGPDYDQQLVVWQSQQPTLQLHRFVFNVYGCKCDNSLMRIYESIQLVVHYSSSLRVLRCQHCIEVGQSVDFSVSGYTYTT